MKTPASSAPGLPSIKLWKARNAACIYLAGRRVVLGPWGSRVALDKYHELMRDVFAGPSPVREGHGLGASEVGPIITVGQLVDAHARWARGYYVKAGRMTSTVTVIERVGALLTRYGSTVTLMKDAGPLWLTDFQQALAADADRTWTRQTINEYVRTVVSMFQWAVARQLLAADKLAALKAVAPLRKGRPAAAGVKPPRENRKVTPIERADLQRARRMMPRTIRALIAVHLLTGARPSEVCAMKWGDIRKTRNPRVFVYRVDPSVNKTEHLEDAPARLIYLGPRAMRLVRMMLPELPKPTDYVFSPRRAAIERAEKLRAIRKTKLWPSHSSEARKARRRQFAAWRGERVLAECYCPLSYNKAIKRACTAAGVASFTPYRLRHTGATRAAERLSIEVAQSMLGHSDIGTTRGYVAVSEKRASKAAARVG